MARTIGNEPHPLYDMVSESIRESMDKEILRALSESTGTSQINMQERKSFSSDEIMDAIRKMGDTFPKPTYTSPFNTPIPYEFDIIEDTPPVFGERISPVVRVPGFIGSVGNSRMKQEFKKDDLKLI